MRVAGRGVGVAVAMRTHANILLVVAPVLGACLPDAAPQASRAVIGLVFVDASPSSPGQSDRCAQVVARANQLLLTKAKTVAFLSLATGDEASGSEPLTLTDWRVFRRDRQAFESPDAEEKKQRAFLTEINDECRHHFHSRRSSPVFAAIVRAVDSARARKLELEAAGAEVMATVFVHSDLRENGDKRITRHLAPRGRSKRPALPTLNTDGIAVRVCGVNDHISTGSDAVDVLRIGEVWSEIIPDLGPLDASCPSLSLTTEGK